MTIKEFLLKRLQLFFFLSVMILIAQAVVGTIVEPGETLHIRYIDLLSPLFIAALCTVPTLVTYSRKKLTMRQLLIRHAIQLVLIEGVMFVIMYATGTVDFERPWVFALIAVSVLVIYVLSLLMIWLSQLHESKIMTEQLRALQQKE